MGYIVAIGALASAAATGYSAYSSGKQGEAKQQAAQAYMDSLPDRPDLLKQYKQGYEDQLAEAPHALKQDFQLREKYLPKYMQLASDIYGEFLPQFASTNLRTLSRIDPQFVNGRKMLYNDVSRDLGYGSQLTPEQDQQLSEVIRGGQAARGNILGNAPVAAEALYKGDRAQQLYQQRLSNMQSFLRGPSPEDKFSQLAGQGSASIQSGQGIATNPDYEFIDGPKNWANTYLSAAQTDYSNATNPTQAQAFQVAQTPPSANPWLASLAGGLQGASQSLQSRAYQQRQAY